MKTNKLYHELIKELQGGKFDLELNKRSQIFELVLSSDLSFEYEAIVVGSYQVNNIEFERETYYQPSSLEFDIDLDDVALEFSNNDFNSFTIDCPSIICDIQERIDQEYEMEDIAELI